MAIPRMTSLAIHASTILAVGLSSPALAQAPVSDEGQRIPASRLRDNDRSKLASWRDGKSAPESQLDQEVLKRAAEWYIYRLTNVELQKRIPREPLVLSTGETCQEMLERDFYPLLML